MNLLKNKIVSLYLNGSIHVSLSVLALIQMTFYFCQLPFDPVVSIMGFTGTLFSYNFIKYGNYVMSHKGTFSSNLKIIILQSVLSLFVASLCFFFLNTKAQLASIVLFFLAFLYAIPIHKSVSNLRNLAGLKVYLVCFSWATMTLIIPVLNAGLDIDLDVVIKFIQRFILIFILMGIFEIVDLSVDSVSLRTLPQTLGINKTKIILALLLVPFFVIELFKDNYQVQQAYNNIVVVLVTLFFIYKATPYRSQFFTLFWVESIPILWYLIVLIQGMLER